MTNQQQSAYALLRLPLGVSFLVHGIARLPKLTVFAEGMADSFTTTFLPYQLVFIFAYILPFLELVIGILLISGIAVKKSAVVGSLLICTLIFGSGLQENWSAVAIQLFYGLYFCLLFLFSDYNSYTLINFKK